MRNILQYILKILAKIILWRHRPVVVAVTGSAGKTCTKEAIYYVLKKKFRVRRNIRNYNNEIGVPLTILGSYVSPETTLIGMWGWLKIFLKSLFVIIYQKSYPEILILEMGICKPGDMEYLMSFIPVKVGVFTSIGEFPVHLEFFPEKGKLVKEKSILVKSLRSDGLAVLNYDDLSVRMVGDEISDKTKVIYYGFGEGADLKISNYELVIRDLKKKDYGINFKLEQEGSIVPIRLIRVLGKQHALIAAAAASVGLYFNLNLVQISNALRRYRTMAGRTKLLEGIKDSWIIDDSYNASPLSVLSGLDILREFPLEEDECKKIAVLGDMLELGEKTEDGHREVGKNIISTIDILFTVGDRARFIADEAKKHGFSKDNIFEFSRSEDVAIHVQEIIHKGDVVLIKGSRSMRMEKIVKEIMAHPEKADKLLIK